MTELKEADVVRVSFDRKTLRSYIAAAIAAIGRSDEIRDTDGGVAIFDLEYYVDESNGRLVLSSEAVVMKAEFDNDDTIEGASGDQRVVREEIIIASCDIQGYMLIARTIAIHIATLSVDGAIQATFDKS